MFFKLTGSNPLHASSPVARLGMALIVTALLAWMPSPVAAQAVLGGWKISAGPAADFSVLGAPTVTITSPAGNFTKSSPIPVTITFSIPVTGFDAKDLVVVNGTLSNFSGAGAVYTASITPAANGKVTLDIAAGVAIDPDGEFNLAASRFSTTYDTTPPVATLTSLTDSPTNHSPIFVTITFNEQVNGFDLGDIRVGNGTVRSFSGSGAAYILAVTPAAPGVVTVNLASAGLADRAGNAGTAASRLVITYDKTAPTVISILRREPFVSPTNVDKVVFQVTFSETVQKVDPADFETAATGTVTARLYAVNAVRPGVYNVVLAGVGENGTLGLDFAASNDIADLAGNPLGPNPSIGTGQAYTIDTTFPTVLYGDNNFPEDDGLLLVSFQKITLEFSEDVLADGSANAANNPANYVLVEDDNENFTTTGCNNMDSENDKRIPINSAIYSSNGGAGPFLVTLNVNDENPLPDGYYWLYACGTTSIYDPAGNRLNDGADSPLDFIVDAVDELPSTGFAPGRVTSLPEQPAALTYADTDLWLEIPALDLDLDIVGVPLQAGRWDTSWLGQSAGWLQGTAYPTWAGNTVITAHVWDAYNQPGPFASLKSLQYGDQVRIHSGGQVYVYAVRSTSRVPAGNLQAVLKHEELDWVTLVTCEDYQSMGDIYASRRVVRAVLVEVWAE